MKIAIQGHTIRGREVIRILESLGGKNREELTGRRISYYYFINCNGNIDLNLKINLLNRKLYTLEEFETQFPFKIGDMVLLKGVNKPYEIIALECYMDKLCYKLDNGLHYTPETLTTYKEMKEERNVVLTLEKAKEWYSKGGDLKQIALQAFTERELNPLPRSWNEFCETHPIKKEESYITNRGEIFTYACSSTRLCPNVCPSEDSAIAHLAMMQLEQLRDCWRQGWKPTKHNTGYCIIHYPEEYLILPFGFINFLSFPTKKMTEEFLECFRDLIEQAGDLI